MVGLKGSQAESDMADAFERARVAQSIAILAGNCSALTVVFRASIRSHLEIVGFADVMRYRGATLYPASPVVDPSNGRRGLVRLM